MGFFEDYDTPVEDIPTGFGLPIGVYPVILTEIKNHVKEDGTKSTIITFSVNTVEDEKARSGKEDIWLTHPVKGAKNAAVHASIGKQWMKDIGVPESVMAEEGFDLVEQKDSVLGTEGILKVTAGKEGYTKKAFSIIAGESGVSENTGDVPENKAEVAVDTSGW
jgi:hypothetical protein